MRIHRLAGKILLKTWGLYIYHCYLNYVSDYTIFNYTCKMTFEILEITKHENFLRLGLNLKFKAQLFKVIYLLLWGKMSVWTVGRPVGKIIRKILIFALKAKLKLKLNFSTELQQPQQAVDSLRKRRKNIKFHSRQDWRL